jgi:hypothetical protein
MIALLPVMYFHICKSVCVSRDIQSGCHFDVSGYTGTKQISPEVLTIADAHARSFVERNVLT